MEALKMRRSSVACYVIAAGLALIGAGAWYVSATAIEGNEGVYIEIGSATYQIPDLGSLGDHGSFCAEWGVFSISCLGSALSLSMIPSTKASYGRIFLKI